MIHKFTGQSEAQRVIEEDCAEFLGGRSIRHWGVPDADTSAGTGANVQAPVRSPGALCRVYPGTTGTGEAFGYMTMGTVGPIYNPTGNKSKKIMIAGVFYFLGGPSLNHFSGLALSSSSRQVDLLLGNVGTGLTGGNATQAVGWVGRDSVHAASAPVGAVVANDPIILEAICDMENETAQFRYNQGLWTYVDWSGLNGPTGTDLYVGAIGRNGGTSGVAAELEVGQLFYAANY